MFMQKYTFTVDSASLGLMIRIFISPNKFVSKWVPVKVLGWESDINAPLLSNLESNFVLIPSSKMAVSLK